MQYSSNCPLREELTIKPNQRLVLVHPTYGFLPFLVQQREPFYFVFNRILTNAALTSLTGGATITGIQPFDAINRDALEVKTRNLIYHTFIGLAPSHLKLYFEYPKGTIQRTPDNQNFTPTSTYGFLDGWQSPFADPTPAGEFLLPWGRNTTGWQFHNPTTLAITQPLLKFIGYTYKVEVIRNVDLVQSILEERPGAYAAKKPLGGLTGFTYDPREPYDADWIPFDWERSDIMKALQTRQQTGGA